jgi:NADPH-dependent 2,4-dienoyl-CoA reductase/sulfur reductase-like enzyme
MKKEKVVVIGTNHAGTHSILEIANKYKDTHEVVTYDKNDNISFLGCGMALWIGGVIDSGDGLFYATPESLCEAGAEVHMKHDFKNVDFDKKTIEIEDLETGKMKTENYDKLIFAIGSWPILPPLPGHDLENIIYAKIFQNAQGAIEKIKDPSIKKVTVVGAGYIGIELVEAFKENGKEVTLINDMDVLNRYYDSNFQEMMRSNLEKNGIIMKLGETVTEFAGDGKVNKVIMTKGEYDTDLVFMSIGFKPNTGILADTGIELSPRGAILTNNRMETSIKDVYAIGDCATVYNNASEQFENIALATNAVRTGIVAGHNACGTPLEMQGVQGSNAIHIFGLTLCSTGLTECVARSLGMDVETVEHTDLIKSAFMPENDEITVKVVWDKETKRIIGAQMASTSDITLALHFFSLAIQERYTIDKLALTDTFFLPHFNQPHNFITKAGLLALGKL